MLGRLLLGAPRAVARPSGRRQRRRRAGASGDGDGRAAAAGARPWRLPAAATAARRGEEVAESRGISRWGCISCYRRPACHLAPWRGVAAAWLFARLLPFSHCQRSAPSCWHLAHNCCTASACSAAHPFVDCVPPHRPQPERSQLPASPMELLRYLNSPEYQRSQEELWARVHGSYEVRASLPSAVAACGG